MANIPTEISPEQVARPQMSPQMAGAGANARADAAQQEESSAFTGAHVANLLQQAQDRVDLMALDAHYRDTLEKKLETYQENPDYRNFEKTAKEDEEALRTDFLNNPVVKDNPRLQSQFAPRLQEYMVGFNKGVHHLYMQGLQRDGMVQYNGMVNKTEQDMANFPPGPERDAIYSDFKSREKGLVEGHLINPVQVAEKEEKMMANVQEARVLTHGRSDDPAKIQHAIDMLEMPAESDHIDPKTKAIYKESFEGHLERVQEKIDKHIDKVSVDNAVDELDRKFTHPDGSKDFEAIEKSINNPDFRAEHNLDTERTNKVRSFFEAVRAQHDHIEREVQKKENDQIIHEFLHGNYSKVLKMIDSPDSQLSSEQKTGWVNHINSEKREARTEAREGRTEAREARTESSAKKTLDIEMKIMNGDITDKLDIYKEIAHGLKPTDADRLMKDFGTLQSDLNHKVDSSNKYLENQIAPSRGALLPTIPAEKARAQQAQMALHSWVKQENKKVMEGKRPSLTPDEVYNKAVEIAPSYRMKIDEKIDNIKSSMKEKTPKPGEYTQSDIEFTAKKHGISVDEVKKRLGIGNRPASPKTWYNP